MHEEKRDGKCPRSEDVLGQELQIDGPDMEELSVKLERLSYVGEGRVTEKWSSQHELNNGADQQVGESSKHRKMTQKCHQKARSKEQDVHLRSNTSQLH
jgi:hypothetical protein